MKAYLGSDIGKTRTENQDSIRAESFPDGVLALVCDGMGGMQNGSAASKIAVAAAEEDAPAVETAAAATTPVAAAPVVISNEIPSGTANASRNKSVNSSILVKAKHYALITVTG